MCEVYVLVLYLHYLDHFKCFSVAEPRTGFHIAFKMLDVDGNEQVDKKEFLKVRPVTQLDGLEVKCSYFHNIDFLIFNPHNHRRMYEMISGFFFSHLFVHFNVKNMLLPLMLPPALM